MYHLSKMSARARENKTEKSDDLLVVNLVELGGPNVAAPRGIGISPNNSCLSVLEAL